MSDEGSAREQEFRDSIKKVEREKFWFPFVLFGGLGFYIWLAGGNVFERPTLETVYPIITLVALLYTGTEILNLKILLIKAEYRDWLREFRKEKWVYLNTD